MSKNKFIVVFFIICSLQISCGFQLRKPISVNYESYSIIGDSTAITQNIKKQFSYGKIAEEKSGNGELVIEILENNFNKRILSLAANGQVGEFELIQTVSYRIKSKDKWIDLCILLGCDYLPRIHGLGFKSSFKYITLNKNLEYPEIIEKIRDKNKYSIPDNYTEKFKKAKDIFRNTQPMKFKESDLDKYNILFDNQVEIVKEYLKKYTQLSEQKIKNRIKNIFNYSI